MAWNASFIRPFVPRAGEEQAFTFLYDHHGINAHYPPGVEMKCGAFGVVENPQKVEAPGSDQKINNQDRKRRLTSEQIDSLERCFQEEVKLEPERKMKLAFELGLQPRQVAVWFQNRRARWKAKELERLYLALKQDFDAISNQKQQLQEEVIKLKAKLEERSVAAAHTEVSGEETVESTSVVIPSSNKSYGTSYYQVGECSYIFNVDDCNNPVSLPYWGVLPAYI